ncbi:hypothetical protein [Nonomuraea sp. NPDC001831]|uniref:hypothetical protein n=1 Tax=Nonomuraea sp. NPDC001831 TaxID=3364340 RepID=UPI0036D168C0
MTRLRGVLRASAAALAVTAALAAATPAQALLAPSFRAVDPPGDPTTLWSVDVLDAAHAYAVGWRGYDGSPDTSVLRWDGSSWSRLPLTAGYDVPSPCCVAAVAPDQVYVTGSRSIADVSWPRSAFWNGSTWSEIPPPPGWTPPVPGDEWTGPLAATKDGSLWSIRYKSSGGTDILRLRQGSWTVYPRTENLGLLRAVDGGDQIVFAAENGVVLWDGTALRSLGRPGVNPRGVYVEGPGRIWVSGYQPRPNRPATPAIARYDGARWTVSALPGAPGNGSASISGDGEGHLVIPTGGGTTSPAYLYFDGASWTRVSGPARPSAGYAGAYALDRVPGTSTILSVGGANVTNLTGFAISDVISPR